MANKGSTRGGFSKVINTIRKEANQAVDNIKKDVIDTVRSEMDGITVDVGAIDVDVDAKINGNLRKRLSDQIKKQIPEKIQQELEIELTPKFAGKIQKINLDNMIQMNSKELKKKIDEYYDSAVEGSETGSKRFVAAMKIAKFRGIELDDDVFDDYEYAFEQFEKGAKGYAEKLDNILKGIDFSLISKSAQKSSDYIIEAFKGIIRESKSVGSVEKFLNGIRDGSIEATDKVKGLLSITQVLSNGKYSFSAIDEGTRHSDGFVSDEYTVIARESKYEEKTDTLIPKLQQAEKAGVRLGTVIGTIKDDANGLFYEIRKTQKGKIINEDNLEFLEATDEEILKFKKDLQTLQKLGLYVDTGGQNIMYQKGLGFSFIDLAMPKKGEKVPDYLKNDFEGIAEAFEEYLPYNGETFELTPESQSALDNFKREISETADVVEAQIKRMGDSVDKYNGIISRMKKPGFHVGNMEKEETYISDSFQSNQSLERMGSGSFWMTDIEDALTFLEEQMQRSEGTGEKVKLYITDLGNVLGDMTNITSVDEFDEYTEFLGSFNKFVMALATDGDEANKYAEDLEARGITDLDTLYKEYKLYFDNFGITREKLDKIIKDSVRYAKESIKSGAMVDDLSAFFQSKYLGLKGVTTKDVADLDNQGVGTVVFHKEDLGDIFAVDSKDQLNIDTIKTIFKQALLEKAQNDENTINEFNYLLNKYEDSPVLKQLYSDGELSSIISEMKKVHTEARDGMMSIIEDYDAVDDAANERADRIRGLIVRNNDTRDYQGIDWLEEYEDRARAGFESVDDLYEEYVDRLERRKKELLDTESTNKNNLSLGTTTPSQIETIAQAEGEVRQESNAISTDLERQNEKLGEQKSLYNQIFERVEKIRILGAVGRPKEDLIAYGEGKYGFESPDIETYRMQMNSLKTLTPSGKSNADIRDLVFDPSKTIEEVTKELVRAAEDYQTCKQSLDEMFSKAGIVGGKLYDDAYRMLYNASLSSEDMANVVSDTKAKLGMLQQENTIREESRKKKEAEAQAQAELNKQKSAEPISNETLVSTESTNADTKALLSKKEVVERLRAELNLTKKAAEELFDAQGYKKSSKGQYEIEKEAVDELINSYEELQKVNDTSNTIPSTDIGEIKEETKANLDLVDSMDKVDKEKADDSANQVTAQSAKLTAEEAQAMADLFDKALKAAEAKEKFAGANKQVLESIITSLSALNSEGDGFNNLNKIINNLTNNKDDRITNLIKNLTSIRDILSTSINEDAFINALRDIANQGESLKDLATVLKATQSQINKAKQSIKSQSSTNPVSPVQSDQKDVRGTSRNQQYDSQGNVTREVSSFTVRNQSGRNTRYTRTTNGQTGEIQYAIHETTDYNKAIDDTVTAIIQARKVQHELNLEWEKTKPNQDRINALTDELSDYYRVIRQATQAAHDFEQENADWYNDTATGSKYGQQQHFTDYVRQRVTQGIAKEDERYASYISKRNENFISQAKNDLYDANFLLSNGNNIAQFEVEIKQIISDLTRLNDIKTNPITEKSVDLARQYHERLKQIKKEATLSENKKANENSILKNLGQINELLSGNTKLSFRNTDVYRDLINLQNEFKNFDTSRPQSELKDLTTRFLEVKSRFNELSETFKGDNLFITFIKRLHSTTAQLIAQYFSFQDIIRYVRSMATTIIDLDTQLVDLRKTTTMSATELESFYNSSSDVAKQLGVTTSEIISQASAWSRLGYSSQEAATKMAKFSSQFASISPGMDTESATDALVSTMQAYKIGVDDVQRTVMDNINAIGNTMATTNSEIGEMLQRSSAAMKAANNTLEETIALESAAVEITRNAETTGTAFRTKIVHMYSNMHKRIYLIAGKT